MNIFQGTKKIILDILFPISCLSCEQDGFWLCDECLQKIPILNFQVCPRCERIITEKGILCHDCKKYAKTVIPNTLHTNINSTEGSSRPVIPLARLRRELAEGSNFKIKESFCLDALITATEYNKNNISKIVHIYKYNFARDLADPLGTILAKGILKSELSLPDFIVPIPLHSRRLRWRGFNQAELLAKIVSQKLTPGFEIPILNDLLIRKKYTSPQMKIQNYFDRQKNIQNSFYLNPLYLKTIKNKKVLLIDNIATTASTLLECARVLKFNGAKKIFAAVIARQEFRKK